MINIQKIFLLYHKFNDKNSLYYTKNSQNKIINKNFLDFLNNIPLFVQNLIELLETDTSVIYDIILHSKLKGENKDFYKDIKKFINNVITNSILNQQTIINILILSYLLKKFFKLKWWSFKESEIFWQKNEITEMMSDNHEKSRICEIETIKFNFLTNHFDNYGTTHIKNFIENVELIKLYDENYKHNKIFLYLLKKLKFPLIILLNEKNMDLFTTQKNHNELNIYFYYFKTLKDVSCISAMSWAISTILETGLDKPNVAIIEINYISFIYENEYFYKLIDNFIFFIKNNKKQKKLKRKALISLFTYIIIYNYTRDTKNLINKECFEKLMSLYTNNFFSNYILNDNILIYVLLYYADYEITAQFLDNSKNMKCLINVFINTIKSHQHKKLFEYFMLFFDKLTTRYIFTFLDFYRILCKTLLYNINYDFDTLNYFIKIYNHVFQKYGIAFINFKQEDYTFFLKQITSSPILNLKKKDLFYYNQERSTALYFNRLINFFIHNEHYINNNTIKRFIIVIYNMIKNYDTSPYNDVYETSYLILKNNL